MLLCAYMTSEPRVLGNAANTETFTILPLVAGALATLRAVERSSLAWACAAGALSALALLCKQVAIFNVLFFFSWLWWCSPRRWLLSAATLVGLALPLLLVAGAFQAAGSAFAEFYDCTIGYNLSYAARVPLSEYPPAFVKALGFLLVALWPVYLLAAPLLPWAIGAAFSGKAVPQKSQAYFVLLWLASTFLCAATGGQFFPHYFITTLPPLALAAALVLVRVSAARTSGRWPRILPALVTGAIIVYGVLLSPWYYLTLGEAGKCRKIYGVQNPFAESIPLSEYVARNTRPDETIFIAGSEPQVYYYSERKSASRYIFIYPLLTPFPAVVERQRLAVDEVRQADPRLIIGFFMPASLRMFEETPPVFFDEMHSLILKSYRVVAVIPFRQGESITLVTGSEAEELYASEPVWFGTVWDKRTLPRCTAVVWEKIDHP